MTEGTRKLSPEAQKRIGAIMAAAMSDELFRVVSAVAGARGESASEFVREVLEQRTKEHKEDVERMAARERTPKTWQ